MTNTTYYNLNIVEGTDIVNPLTVDNPNYEIIDDALHDNAVSGVTLATEIANATVHAITRENSDCAVIRFIATSEWKAGDRATVDGVPVTALLPSGETLPDGAYVINANVLCILTGTNLTVFAERKKIDDASEISYNDTNIAQAITELNSNLMKALPLTKTVTVQPYSYAMGGYEVTVNISDFDGYDAAIKSRAVAIIPTCCYYSSNASVTGSVSLLADGNRITVNASNEGNYFVGLVILYK